MSSISWSSSRGKALSNASGKPIYEQITDQVKEQIMAGALSAGDALPSMRLLAKELRKTARRVAAPYGAPLSAILDPAINYQQ